MPSLLNSENTHLVQWDGPMSFAVVLTNSNRNKTHFQRVKRYSSFSIQGYQTSPTIIMNPWEALSTTINHIKHHETLSTVIMNHYWHLLTTIIKPCQPSSWIFINHHQPSSAIDHSQSLWPSHTITIAQIWPQPPSRLPPEPVAHTWWEPRKGLAGQ